jgi:hypothetical protein
MAGGSAREVPPVGPSVRDAPEVIWKARQSSASRLGRVHHAVV